MTHRRLPILLALLCAWLAHSALADTPAPRAEPTRERTPSTTFQVVLIAAGSSGPSELEELSPAARKALGDVRDFLPYKSFRVIDLAWLRTDRIVDTVVAGPDGASFRVAFQIDPWRNRGDELLRIDKFVVEGHAPERAPRQLLETSFAVSPGETVVVGTSRLDGTERALIVLLTALP